MLFTEAELYTGTNFESILSEAVYLTEDESMIKPKAIPVVENKRLGAAVVDFKDISALAEDYGISYIDAMGVVAEANSLETSSLAVSVDEAEIIESPYLVESLNNVVVKPLSENDSVYNLVESAVEYIAKTDDDDFVYNLFEAVITLQEAKKGKISGEESGDELVNMMNKNQLDTRGSADVTDSGTVKTGATKDSSKALAAMQSQLGAKNSKARKNALKAIEDAKNNKNNENAPSEYTQLMHNAENVANDTKAKPGVISRMIAALRRWTEKVQSKYNEAPAEKRSMWLKIKNKIASLLQKLTRKLQSDEKYAAANAYHDAQKKA